MSAVKAFFAPFFSAVESVSHGGLAGQLNVCGNLLLKGFQVGESTVAAQAFKEADFDVATVQVGIEAGHMEFEFQVLIVGGIEGGAAAVVEHGAAARAANEGVDDIDAGGGQDFVMRIEVGRGEAELAADAAAASGRANQLRLEDELVSYLEEQGLEIYEPDLTAFREHVQAEYVGSEFAASWPDGVLEQINALGN